MENYYPYPCKQCGDCCRCIDKVEFASSLNRGDGVCKYLRTDNLCAIYTHRPNVCNGQYMYEHFYSYMSVAEFHEMTTNFCKKIHEFG